MSRLWIALRSIVYAALFLTLWTWVALTFRALDRFVVLVVPQWLIAPGIALVVAGSTLALATVGYFIFEGRGTPAIFDPPKKFVPHGPYRHLRNPMYAGYFLFLLGLGLCLKSASMILFAAGALLLIHTFVVWAEEPALRKRFGQEYVDYCHAVPRWIPRLTRRRLPP